MSRILVVGGGAIGGITAAQMDADVVVLDANEAHVAALRDPASSTSRRAASAPRCSTPSPRSTSSRGSSTSRWSRSSRRCTTSRWSRWWRAAGSARSSRWATGSSRTAWRASSAPGNLLACIVEWGGSNVGPGRLVRDSLGGYMVGELDGTISRARARAGARSGAGRPRARDRQRARDDLVQAADQHDVHRALGGVGPALRRRRRAGPGRGVRALGRGRRGRRRAGPEARVDPRHQPARVRRGRAGADDGVDGQRAAVDAAGPRRGARRPRSTSSTAAWPRKGRELGIATPCNDAVVELVHSMERGERSPEPRWLAYVSEAQTTSATDT